MNLTKRIFATLLCFSLILGFAAPTAFAQQDETQAAVNWEEFYITKQPQGMIIPHGERFALSVEVNVPEGVEVKYQWFANMSEPGSFSRIAPASAKPEIKFSMNGDYPIFDLSKNPYSARYRDYYCQITADEKSDDGTVVSSRQLKSDTVRVIATYDFKQKMQNITLVPLQAGFICALATFAFTSGIGTPLMPFTFLGTFLVGFAMGFAGLFVIVSEKDLIVDSPT